MICEFCTHDFDEACGRYGCPNCLGEGLNEKDDPMKPYSDHDVACRCADCGELFAAGVLNPIKDPGERLSAGEEVPAGECPDCGACAFIDEQEPALHPELTACKKCGDPIYMDTIFDVCNEHCARCAETVDAQDEAKQEAYVCGFSEGRRQRRADEQDKTMEFADLVAHRIRSLTGDEDTDAEILDMIDADARRLGVV